MSKRRGNLEGSRPAQMQQRRRQSVFCLLLLPVALLALPAAASGASTREAQQLFFAGTYAECIELAAAEIDEGVYIDQWPEWKIRAELATGDYESALATAKQSLTVYPFSAPLRLLAHVAYRFNDQPIRASAELATLERLVVRNPRRYSTPRDKLALGRLFLLRDADARQVLELFFDPVVERWPELPEGFLESAELALAKSDHALAAEVLAAAPDAARQNPHYHYLVARAYSKDDPQRAGEALASALEVNPRHADSLLIQVDNLVDAEQYDQAEQLIERVKKTNPRHPLAWAYQAVLAHLRSDAAGEASAREQALSTWSQNPEVDHLIGRKLSEKYRFAEGAEYQRQALAADPDYLPAQLQLAQDLLRLGRDDRGWELMNDVVAADGYNVVAHNLVTLQDTIESYRVLVDDDFRVRMDAREAAIYGQRVLDLLQRAKSVLCQKYDVQLKQPISVEIFAQQKDFAVRTFGMPGAEGFLGVCFGNVITANSPAALGQSPANWEAVLWHEFCHVVTLHKTRNKMPRWLSEGISVYEEKQQESSWGQAMTPQYRRFILDGQMPPVSDLSSSFLAPESPLHLQFAYFQSSLAVEHVIASHGLDSLKRTLDDLAAGLSINDALSRNVAPINRLDQSFERFARERAEALAPRLTWEELDLPADASTDEIAAWLDEHPDNYFALQRLAVAQQREEQWEESLATAQRLVEHFPNDSGSTNGYALIARASRELGDVEAEREALRKQVDLQSDAVDPLLRLLEIDRAQQDWKAVRRNARRLLAVNPLIPAPHRYLAEAAGELEAAGDAVDGYEALLQFDASDPVDVRFRLARLHREQGDASAARRSVLMALEDAPRFRAAHRLLLEIAEPSTDRPPAATIPPNAPKQTAPEATSDSGAAEPLGEKSTEPASESAGETEQSDDSPEEAARAGEGSPGGELGQPAADDEAVAAKQAEGDE